jgi:hypothetical protein
MKKALLLFCILFSAHYVSAQWWCEINFNQNGTIYSTNSPTYYFDSLWQFGTTSKEAFQEDLPNVDGAYKLCTDTLNPISDTGRWEMYFGIDRDTLDFFNQCIEKVEFRAFQIRFKGIKDSTGLLVEISPDSIKWFNVLSDDAMNEYRIYTNGRNLNIYTYLNSISILDGEPLWLPDTIWNQNEKVSISPNYTIEDAGSLSEIHFRLSYISKTFTPHAGVAMVSPNVFIPVFCEFININEIGDYGEVALYPNPVNECSVFELSEKFIFPVQITIADPTGRILHKSRAYNRTIPLSNINLGSGVYIFNIKDANGYTTSGNFLVN